MSCLEDVVLYEFADGLLSGPALVEADAHLDSCPDCRAVVVGLARTTGSEAAAGGKVSLATGALVGRYVTLGAIGQGAMGVVYAAYDPELDRKVALKLLRSDIGAGDARLQERMVSEARAMARLSHPNVVTIYEVGTHNGAVFLAMELVEGANLRAWLEAETRSWDEIHDVFVQAARGLAAAHKAGLVHRDFKPENVLVAPDGRARVTDFGLARDDGQRAPIDTSSLSKTTDVALTQTGAIVGTPAYMAPEQLSGGEVTTKSDQFSFCVALHEAMYGQRPFAADTLEGLAQKLDSGVIEPPKSSSKGPRWLDSVVATGLRKSPAERHESMEDLIEALHRSSKARLWIGAAAVAAMAVVIALVVRAPSSVAAVATCDGGADRVASVWGATRSHDLARSFERSKLPYAKTMAGSVGTALDRWAAEWSVTHRSTCQATHVEGTQSPELLDVRMHCLDRRLQQTSALIDELERGDSMRIERALVAVESLPPASECTDIETLAGAPRPTGESGALLDALERDIDVVIARLSAGRVAEAKASAKQLVARATTVGFLPAIAEAQLVIAKVEVTAGKYEASDLAAHAALWAADEAGEDFLVARAWLAIVNAAGSRDQPEIADKWASHARAALARLGNPQRLAAKFHNSVGLIATNLGRFDEASVALSKSLDLRMQLVGGSHTSIARSHSNLGDLARLRGEFDAALDHHQTALAIDLKAVGDGHPSLARHHHNIGGVLRMTSKLDEAHEHYRRSLEIRIATLGTAHPLTALTHNSLGLVFAERGDLDGAEAHYQTALNIFDSVDSGKAAMVRHNLGLIAHHRSDYAGAVVQFEQALAGYRLALGNSHLHVAEVSMALGITRLALGERAQAIEAMSRALLIAGELGSTGDELATAARGGLKTARSRRGTLANAKVPSKPVPGKPVADQAVPGKIAGGIAKPDPIKVEDSKPKPKPPKRPPPGVYGGSQAWD